MSICQRAYQISDIPKNHIQFSILFQDELERIDPNLLKLGLLSKVEENAYWETETLLSYQHKSIHEFICSTYLARRLGNIMRKGQEVKVKYFSNFCTKAFKNCKDYGSTKR